jgi:hypothetical protein
LALAVSVPNAYTDIYKTAGSFGFFTCDGIVCSVGGAAAEAGVKLGDRLEIRALPLGERYPDFVAGRLPVPGSTVTFPFERNGRHYTATLTSTRDAGGRLGLDLVLGLIGKTLTIALAVIVGGLFLVRPTPLSRSLALYTLGTFALNPVFYAFLPVILFAGLQIIVSLFFASGTIGFLGLALNLGRTPKLFERRIAAVLYLILSIAVTCLILFALAGIPTIGPFAITYAGITCVMLAGTVILTQTAFRVSLSAGERIAAALLATAGIAAAYFHATQIDLVLSRAHAAPEITNLFIPHLGGTLSTVIGQLTMFVPSAAAAYVVARDRVVDIGLVRSRILADAAVIVAILGVFVFLNWAFAATLARYPFGIPLEIFAALAIGYRFGGFRDVAGALSLSAVDAPIAAMHGRRNDEDAALAHALGLAERSRQPSLIVEVHARYAFAVWSRGDDVEFERHVVLARQRLGTQTLRGIRTFLLTATSDSSPEAPRAGDLPEWLARTALLTFSRATDAREAETRARDALIRADESALPWLRILTRVALAETTPSERDNRLNDAQTIAREAGSQALAESLASLATEKRDLGMLQSFVDVRVRRIRPVCPELEVAFFTGEVKVMGDIIDLPDKERELLFTVAASNRAINGESLCDALWPDSDGDAARNTLYVCLHRLRRRTRNPQIVRRLDRGYGLHPGAVVDLWKLETAIAEKRADDVEALYGLLRDGETSRSTLGPWFMRFEARLAETGRKAELALRQRINGQSARS